MAILPAPAILVVAPPSLQCEGLLLTLRTARPDLRLTTTPDARTLPHHLQRHAPALLILDAALGGPALTRLLANVQHIRPGQRLLVLGGQRLPFPLARLVVEMGGGMLLARRATPTDVLTAVLRLLAASPEPELEPEAAAPLGLHARRNPQSETVSGFSPRELEVLRLIAADHTNQEIAARLFISVRTVEAHRRVLLEKTRTRSAVGLVLHAVRNGWLQIYDPPQHADSEAAGEAPESP